MFKLRRFVGNNYILQNELLQSQDGNKYLLLFCLIFNLQRNVIVSWCEVNHFVLCEKFVTVDNEERGETEPSTQRCCRIDSC